MTYTQIRIEIEKCLHIGRNLSQQYVFAFQKVYDGDKRAIEAFSAKYSDDGKSVIMTYTIAGKPNDVTVDIQKSMGAKNNNQLNTSIIRNIAQRTQIIKLVETLESVKSDLEEMQSNEEELLDNMPEGLQESERGEAMQEAMEVLEDAANSIEEAIDRLNEVV